VCLPVCSDHCILIFTQQAVLPLSITVSLRIVIRIGGVVM
jgi:hypothetical protein